MKKTNEVVAQEFNVQTDSGGKWISNFEVEKLLTAVIAKCAEVAAKNPANASEAIKAENFKINFYNNFPKVGK